MTEVLETLLLASHLLCVNVAAGGPIVAAWLDWRAYRGDAAAAWSARQLGGWSVGGLVAGGLLGVLLGWLKWDAAYRALWLGPLSYKAYWAGIELVFSLLIMLGWWWWLPRAAGGSRAAMITRGMLALLAATNLLYHFPVLFTVAARLVDAGQTAGEPIRGPGFREQMLVAETPALTIHVVLASIAVAGTMLIGFAMRRRRQGREDEAARLATWGGRWALLASLGQLPIGIWTLFVLPATAQASIMGYSTVGTLLLVSSLVAVFWLLRELVNVALGETTRPVLVRAMAAMLVTVVLMTGVLQATRTARAVGSASFYDSSSAISFKRVSRCRRNPFRGVYSVGHGQTAASASDSDSAAHRPVITGVTGSVAI